MLSKTTPYAAETPSEQTPAHALPAAAPHWLLPMGLLVLHVLTWTIYGTIALGASTIHDDMIEAWNWSQSPQLGYYKHPPLFAWTTWLWFKLMPITNWSFYLFSAVNSAFGLAGVLALARFFGLERDRATVVSLLLLTPLYGFLALKYNANAVLIPIWPWATYYLLRSFETRRATDGLLLGFLSGLAVLGKYYSVLLLFTFFVVSLLPEHRRLYYRSGAPYAAAIVALLVVAPHAVWTVEHGYPTVQYALSKFRYPLSQIVYWAAVTAFAPIVYLGPPAILVAAFGASNVKGGLMRIGHWLTARGNLTPSLLFAFPFLLTLAFGFAGHAKVSLSYTIPIFYLAPLILLSALPAARGPALAWWAPRLAVVFMGLVLLASPFIAISRFLGRNEIAIAPIPELGRETSRIWRETFGKPLAIVGSGDRFIGATSFYGPDRPLYFVNLKHHHAPWVTEADLARHGMMIICRKELVVCRSFASPYEGNGSKQMTISLSPHWWWMTGPPTEYYLLLVPPHRPPPS